MRAYVGLRVKGAMENDVGEVAVAAGQTASIAEDCKPKGRCQEEACKATDVDEIHNKTSVIYFVGLFRKPEL